MCRKYFDFLQSSNEEEDAYQFVRDNGSVGEDIVWQVGQISTGNVTSLAIKVDFYVESRCQLISVCTTGLSLKKLKAMPTAAIYFSFFADNSLSPFLCQWQWLPPSCVEVLGQTYEYNSIISILRH